MRQKVCQCRVQLIGTHFIILQESGNNPLLPSELSQLFVSQPLRLLFGDDAGNQGDGISRPALGSRKSPGRRRSTETRASENLLELCRLVIEKPDQ